MSLFNHELRHSPYESALISVLAVQGIKDDKGWASPLDYTTTYSAMIKIRRMLVVRQAYQEREDKVQEKMRMMDEKKVRKQTRGIFTITRDKVRRFMVAMSQTMKPSPTNWILSARTYEIKIQYNTPRDNKIS